MDNLPSWPPKDNPHNITFYLLSIQAFLTGGKLVWLRDVDEVHVMAVANKKHGQLVAYRWWPDHNRLFLQEDGTVKSMEDQTKYVRHWILARNTDKVYMYLQNSDEYTSECPY